MPPRHQTQTQGHGTHRGRDRDPRSAQTTETEALGQPPAPVMKPRQGSAGALGCNKQNGRNLRRSKPRTQSHTHAHTYPPEHSWPSAAGRTPRPAHTGPDGWGQAGPRLAPPVRRRGGSAGKAAGPGDGGGYRQRAVKGSMPFVRVRLGLLDAV